MSISNGLNPHLYGLTIESVQLSADDSNSSVNSIPPTVRTVEVVSVVNDANDWITLPSLSSIPSGHEIVIIGSASSNFEVRTPASSNEKINSIDSDGTDEFLFEDGKIYKFVKFGNTEGWFATEHQQMASSIFSVKKSLTSAQILALNTTPIEVIPAPGSGKVVQVLGAFLAYTYATAAYATNTVLLLVNANGTNEIANDGGALLSDLASSKSYMSIVGGANSIVTNDAVVIEAQTGDPTDGDGTVDVYVTYQIITL